ncbi:hypothetical protein Csa_009788 [Cucumis sativus]|nr:hypothetical protein Csa_009788 [Cucumis sativus]
MEKKCHTWDTGSICQDIIHTDYNLIASLIDDLMGNQKGRSLSGSDDVFTQALGGKDRPGILRGVGKYVTKKKYFYTPMESKEGNEERTVYEEHDQMAKRIIELKAELHIMKKDECAKGDEEEQDPSMCSKGTPSIEWVSDDETEDVASDSVPDKAADVVT